MGWLEVSRPGVIVVDSPRESATFGFPTARLTVGAGTKSTELETVVDSLAMALQRNKLVIARWASECSWVAGVLSTTGFRLIPNTTLVYWSINTNEAPGVTHPESLNYEPSSDVTAELIREIFETYPNHYATNKFLPANTSLNAYLDWARNLADGSRAKMIEIQTEFGNPAGIGITLDLRPGAPVTEVLLAGIVPKDQKRGLYGQLMAAMCDLAQVNQSTNLVISTQADNTNVQKAWIRSGLKPVLAIDGCHLISETITP